MGNCFAPENRVTFPFMEPHGIVCPRCNSASLRLSMLRSGDVRWLLTLRYPFRCRDCDLRSYVFIWQALAIRRARRVLSQ